MMQSIKDASRNLKAWFRIEKARSTGKDEVDGAGAGQRNHGLYLTPYFDQNNNASAPDKRTESSCGADPAITDHIKNNKLITSSFWIASVVFCGYMYKMLYHWLPRSK